MKASVLSMVLVVAACGDNGGGGGNDMAVAVDMAMKTGDMAISATCDPFKQNCANTADKCQVELSMDASGMTTVMNVCIADGTVDEGMMCTRAQANTISDDNCKKGLACTARGVGMPVCRKICKVDTDCPNNQKCTGYDSMVATGLCSPSCALFGTDCSNGLNCNSIYSGPGASTTGVPLCGSVGTGALGASCDPTMQAQCGPNMFCASTSMTGNTGVCLVFCDDSHPCPGSSADGGTTPDGGLSCDTQALGASLPNNGGICH
jgi:hypothetical protein